MNFLLLILPHHHHHVGGDGGLLVLSGLCSNFFFADGKEMTMVKRKFLLIVRE